jgi:membrane protein required for colicin V production
MNFIDILLLVPLLYAAWNGFKKGFIIEFFTLLALLVGIYAGIHFSDWSARVIKGNIDMGDSYLPVVAFTLTFLAVGAMVFFAGKMLERMVKVVNLSPVNKLLGILFGVIKMIYTLSIVLILAETYDERGDFLPEEQKEDSLLYYPIKVVAAATIPAIEESAIWLKNNYNTSTEIEGGVTIEDMVRLKEVADSLGITVDDVIRLREMEQNMRSDE